MLCERCGMNNADVHLIKVVNGKRHEECLCRECAKEVLPFEEAAKMLKMTFSLESIMDVQEALRDLLLPAMSDISENENDMFRCPNCGVHLPINLFDETENVVMDANDYEQRLNPNVDEMTNLKKEMEAAVLGERYERAAEIRDRIKELSNKTEIEKGA